MGFFKTRHVDRTRKLIEMGPKKDDLNSAEEFYNRVLTRMKKYPDKFGSEEIEFYRTMIESFYVASQVNHNIPFVA